MARIKVGVTAHRRHKHILKLAKGYRGAKHLLFRKANETVMKALMYARRDRRAKKREFRRLWIARINAATRANGLSYSRFICGLTKADQSGYRSGPQGTGRHGDQRCCRICKAG